MTNLEKAMQSFDIPDSDELFIISEKLDLLATKKELTSSKIKCIIIDFIDNYPYVYRDELTFKGIGNNIEINGKVWLQEDQSSIFNDELNELIINQILD